MEQSQNTTMEVEKIPQENLESEILLLVGGETNVNKLAGAIISNHLQNSKKTILLRTVGAGALNQAVKGVILANQHFSKKGKIAHSLPYFTEIEDKKTAIVQKLFFSSI